MTISNLIAYKNLTEEGDFQEIEDPRHRRIAKIVFTTTMTFLEEAQDVDMDPASFVEAVASLTSTLAGHFSLIVRPEQQLVAMRLIETAIKETLDAMLMELIQENINNEIRNVEEGEIITPEMFQFENNHWQPVAKERIGTPLKKDDPITVVTTQ